MVSNGKKVISTQDIFPLIVGTVKKGSKAVFTVSGNSMRPFIIHNRDQVLLSEANPSHLKVGDIILFISDDNRYILHRIYRKSKEGYYTYGDACLHGDGLVYPEQILGIVEKIYRKGKEIDCNALLWKTIFAIWRELLPFRRQLLALYLLLGRIKRSICLKSKPA